MNNKSKLDPEYEKIVKDNPDKKFILYLRRHPQDEMETLLLNNLRLTYGEYKSVPEDRLVIFIVKGIQVQEFIDKLNNSDTEMYLSFIQDEDELNKPS